MLETFNVAGHSGGAPHALAIDYRPAGGQQVQELGVEVTFLLAEHPPEL